MRTLEEITYEAGRGALADQESLVAGVRQRTGTLLAAAILLAPWRLQFAVDARELYDELRDQAISEELAETSDWLAAAGFSYQALHTLNAPRVRGASWLLGALAGLMVAQTLVWLTALVVH
jgi:hypothetical protein